MLDPHTLPRKAEGRADGRRLTVRTPLLLSLPRPCLPGPRACLLLAVVPLLMWTGVSPGCVAPQLPSGQAVVICPLTENINETKHGAMLTPSSQPDSKSDMMLGCAWLADSPLDLTCRSGRGFSLRSLQEQCVVINLPRGHPLSGDETYRLQLLLSDHDDDDDADDGGPSFIQCMTLLSAGQSMETTHANYTSGETTSVGTIRTTDTPVKGEGSGDGISTGLLVTTVTILLTVAVVAVVFVVFVLFRRTQTSARSQTEEQVAMNA